MSVRVIRKAFADKTETERHHARTHARVNAREGISTRKQVRRCVDTRLPGTTISPSRHQRMPPVELSHYYQLRLQGVSSFTTECSASVFAIQLCVSHLPYLDSTPIVSPVYGATLSMKRTKFRSRNKSI